MNLKMAARRLTPNTRSCSALSALVTLKTISVINLVEGMAYVNWLGKDEVT
jgi:hypothetical protein